MSLRAHLAPKPDRFYLEELPLREGETLIFFFFLLKELLNFIFSSRCKETGIKNSI